jgi:hypothetical protein
MSGTRSPLGWSSSAEIKIHFPVRLLSVRLHTNDFSPSSCAHSSIHLHVMNAPIQAENITAVASQPIPFK